MMSIELLHKMLNERNFDKGYALKCFWKDNKFNEIKLDDSNEFKKISDLCEFDI